MVDDGRGVVAADGADEAVLERADGVQAERLELVLDLEVLEVAVLAPVHLESKGAQ